MGNKKCVISSEVTGQIVRNLVRNLVRSDGIKSLTIVQVFVQVFVHTFRLSYLLRDGCPMLCLDYLSFTSSSTRPRFVEFSIFVQIIFVFFVQISVHVLFCSQISSLSAQPSYLFVSTGRLQLEH